MNEWHNLEEDFCTELTEALIDVNIPFKAIDRPKLRAYEITRNIPYAPTLTNDYVEKNFNNKLNIIREEILDNKVYFIIDDTTDVKNHFAFNVLVGKLDSSKSKPMLISTQFLDEVNNMTISEL
jgi:hypothetical protein